MGDVVSATGIPRDQVESALRDLLESRRGHLEVGETGALVYRFDPKLLKRDAEPLLSRLASRGRAVLREAFKIWIVLMLVVYFVLFVVLVVAAVVASQSRGGSRGRGRNFGLGRRHGGGMPGFWVWYFFWRPGWGWRRPYYGHRWEKRYGGGRGRDQDKVPFIKKVFAFVLGPDTPHPDQRQKDRSVVRLIRARRGVLTATELVQLTGIPLQEAEEEMGRLMGAYDGDIRVTPKGGLVYVFPELMLSAGGRVSEREPDPAWRRLEPAESWTGNEARSNAVIAGINGFNLIAAATAPWFIFPQLGLVGPLAWIGLVWIPVIFSILFFTIPLLRLLGVRHRNRQRQERNLRKILLAQVFQASLARNGPGWISEAGTVERARSHLLPAPRRGQRARGGPDESNLPPVTAWGASFQRHLQRLTAELDGEVEEGPDGTVRYRFPEVLRTFQAAEVVRRSLTLERQEVGEIVYSSDESREEADQREVEAFEREMARQKEMERYLPDPDRVAYIDDFQLAAFDEEMKPGGIRA